LLKILEEEGVYDREFFNSVTLAEMTSYLGKIARASSQKLPYYDLLDE